MRSTSTAAGLQGSNVCRDGPPIFRLNLRGVASHDAKTIRYHVVKIAERSLAQTILVKRGGLLVTAMRNLAVAIAIGSMTDGAINVVPLATSFQNFLS